MVKFLFKFWQIIWHTFGDPAGKPQVPPALVRALRPGLAGLQAAGAAVARGGRAARGRASPGAAKGRAFTAGSANKNDELLNCFDSRFDDSFGKFFREDGSRNMQIFYSVFGYFQHTSITLSNTWFSVKFFMKF